MTVEKLIGNLHIHDDLVDIYFSSIINNPNYNFKVEYEELYNAILKSRNPKKFIEIVYSHRDEIVEIAEIIDKATKNRKLYETFTKDIIENNKVILYDMEAINRVQEVVLVQTLHYLDYLYSNKKITANLKAFDQLHIYKGDNNGEEIMINLDVTFEPPEQIVVNKQLTEQIVENKQITSINNTEINNKINIERMNEYSETLINLKKINIRKKNKTLKLDENRKIEMENEIKEFLKLHYIAIRNPMVFGKRIKEFYDEKLAVFNDLTVEQQNLVIEKFIQPVNSEYILYQALNKFVNDINLEYVNGEVTGNLYLNDCNEIKIFEREGVIKILSKLFKKIIEMDRSHDDSTNTISAENYPVNNSDLCYYHQGLLAELYTFDKTIKELLEIASKIGKDIFSFVFIYYKHYKPGFPI